MSDVFKLILSMSLSGSILILLIILFRPIFKERFSKSWQYYVWLVVILRLLIPFSPEFGLVNSLFDGSIQNSGVIAQSSPENPSSAPALKRSRSRA